LSWRRRAGWVGVAAALALVLGGCSGMFPNTYRFRMIVEVDTPGGVRRGSAVYEVKAANLTKILPEEASRDWSVKGEAVAVDLPGGHTLFALLKTTNGMRSDLATMSMAALDPAFNNDIVESAGRIAKRMGIRSPAPVAASDYPMLVTFADIADPRSVVAVDPANLAAGFGQGVRLRGVSVEVTDDAVTKGIDKKLTWLDQYYDRMLDGQFTNNSKNLANNLTPGAFRQGVKR
jgi:hypothetical protein